MKLSILLVHWQNPVSDVEVRIPKVHSHQLSAGFFMRDSAHLYKIMVGWMRALRCAVSFGRSSTPRSVHHPIVEDWR
jgi:hypothetical protein